jgi:hypothetical protein
MDIGMLWFDNDPKTDLNVKIEKAVNYYSDKYGQRPNLCFIHPSMMNGSPKRLNNVDIKTNKAVRPNHFWIGVNSNSRPGKL